MADLHALDRIKAELQEQFPGWHIWFVPHIDAPTVWCAQPWPLINSGSPEHLAADIRSAHEEAAAEWPALASLAEYGPGAPGIPRVSAAGEHADSAPRQGR
jgi:hypothetical protein